MIAIVGASGSGKSTLLNILGGMDVPSAGRAVVAGYDLGRLGNAERTRFRRRVIGFVWQQTARNLLPYLTAAQNVEMPMILDGRKDRKARALELLDLVGLKNRATHRPDRLSGGEQQRTAIAVALANDPNVVLADEPTGELDSQTSSDVFGLLRRVNRELGTTIVIVTHDAFVSEQVQRTVAIRDGRTSTETLRRTEQTEGGDHRVISEEYAVVDRAGRLQLPRAHVDALDLHNRVRLRLEEDHVGVWPDKAAAVPAGRQPSRRARCAGARCACVRCAGACRRPDGGDPMTAPRDQLDDAAAADGPMVEVRGLVRDYPAGGDVVHALRGIDLEVARGELLAVRGRSGSGKTTLLNLLGGLDVPTAGTVLVDGTRISDLDETAAAGVRRRTVAFVFQTFGLIPILSAAENVEVPLRMVGADPKARDRRVAELLELVGLETRAKHRPHELSGGEQQRVAIARALANRPRLLLADEPTGQLDSETGQKIMLLIRTVVRAEGVTAVVATHDPIMIEVADRVIELLDGSLIAPTHLQPAGAVPRG